jgi:hypothetical protein
MAETSTARMEYTALLGKVSASLDMSKSSIDTNHAVSVDAIPIDQVEVLFGLSLYRLDQLDVWQTVDPRNLSNAGASCHR